MKHEKPCMSFASSYEGDAYPGIEEDDEQVFNQMQKQKLFGIKPTNPQVNTKKKLALFALQQINKPRNRQRLLELEEVLQSSKTITSNNASNNDELNQSQ